MKIFPFIFRLSVVIYLCAMITLALTQIFDIEGIVFLMTFSIALYSILCITIYIAGRLLINSPRRNLYLGLIMMNVLFKMVFSIVIVYIYRERYAPAESYYLLPFIVSYILFTIFETHFMMQQSDAENLSTVLIDQDENIS